jgi:hypothetical protein
MNIHRTNSPQDLQDMGEYFRGLLMVMAADNHLKPAEQERVRRFGLACGFSKKFVEQNIQNVLSNKYIPTVPPRFHSPETAKRFLLEAAEVATCDNELHPSERRWLIDAARVNEIDENLIQKNFDSVDN